MINYVASGYIIYAALLLISWLLTEAASSACGPKIYFSVFMEIPEFFSLPLIIKKKINVVAGLPFRGLGQMS